MKEPGNFVLIFWAKKIDLNVMPPPATLGLNFFCGVVSGASMPLIFLVFNTSTDS